MNFSKQQLAAIEHTNGPALVLAVPGAGKTTVLLERIKRLIAKGVNPESILAMTFSKAQALDMESRFLENKSGHNATFSTIHSFSYGVVRMWSQKNNKVIQLIESSKNYNKYFLVSKFFSDVNKRKINDEELDEFFRVSGYLKNTLQDYKSYSKKYPVSFRNFENIYFQYESFKKDKGLIDFDDMLLLSLKILSEDKEILASLQNKFKYIQIDEGQDTSLIQLKIIDLISKPENNLFIVADDDQSIYGFRGANPNQLLGFKQVYQDAEIYLMESNYRSSKNIVDLSNKVIKNNKNRFNKELQSTKDSKEKIQIISARNTKIQSKYIFNSALSLVEKSESVGILYRNNISSINLINIFGDNPNYKIRDSKLAFYNHFIIKDVFNFLLLAKDPSDIKVFEKIYYKFNLYLKKDFIYQIKKMDPYESIADRLEKCDGVYSFYEDKIDLLRYYLSRLDDLDTDKAVNFIFDDLGYYDYLKEHARRNKTPITNYDRVIDTLRNISEGSKTIIDLENKIKWLREKQKKSQDNSSLITLSTIHGSKGLEYDHVFLIDLIENEFPSSFSQLDDNMSLLEEERRLFYVALTRAKESLTLINLKQLNKNRVYPSIFIKEISKK